MLAIISDIHSNIEALEAVLADARQRGAERIFCLGDVLGYGPDPRPCLDAVREATELSLMGNHDQAVLFEPSKFNIGAEAACYWTREVLDGENDDELRGQRWDYIGAMPTKHVCAAETHQVSELCLVHGSPRRPVNEYIFPDDVFNNPTKVTGCFERFNHLCFVGHTHTPGVFLDTPDFYAPDEIQYVYEIDPAQQAMINVGSVGQPRDRDPRASYVLIEPGLVRFCRVEYDVESVARKVYEVPELDDYLGTRLKDGR
jgi:predicted phosphodiesterase